MKSEGTPETPARGQLWESRGWWLVLAGLAGWHGWLTLGLFGAEQPGQRLFDDQPILSGRHALYLYHGALGAQSFSHFGRSSVYDPAFCAGYPKTPFFSAGSRPAELSLWLGGNLAPAAAYKLGFAACWWLLPLTLAAAARLTGATRGGSCLAALLGLVVAWSAFGRDWLLTGDWDLLLATETALLTLALLLRYHTAPGCGGWLALAVASWGFCFSQMTVPLSLSLTLLFFYYSVGGQHRLRWHFGLLLVVLIAVGGNWFWLRDLTSYWWIQSDGLILTEGAAIPDLGTKLWESVLWKDAPHQGLALSLLGAAVLGLVALRWQQQVLTGRVWGLAILTQVVLALLGDVWELLHRLEPEKLFIGALFLAVIPAARALGSGFAIASRLGRTDRNGLLLGGGVMVLVALLLRDPLGQVVGRCVRPEPLPLGWTPEQHATLEVLRQATTPAARILWEEGPDSNAWTPLLPWHTQRSFIGGLGMKGIEHTSLCLEQGTLAGKSLPEWSDPELADYCRRYNIGWIVARSPATLMRLRDWPVAQLSQPLPGGGRLFTLQRQPDFFLQGRGRVLQCDPQRLILADLTPAEQDQSSLVLSFHYHPEIIASTNRVQVEREIQLHDSIPFIRLRLPGSMSRLTLYWQE